MMMRRATNKNLKRLPYLKASNTIDPKSNGTMAAALGFIAGLQL